MRHTLSRPHGPAKTGAVASAVIAAALGLGTAGCAADAQAPAALPQATCGTAVTHSLNAATRLLSAGNGALSCFETAVRHCRTASLAVTEMGVDTGTSYVFAIAPGGTGCPVTELSRAYSANFGGTRGAVTSVRCQVAGVTAAGVTLGCAGHRVLVPAQVTLP